PSQSGVWRRQPARRPPENGHLPSLTIPDWFDLTPIGLVRNAPWPPVPCTRLIVAPIAASHFIRTSYVDGATKELRHRAIFPRRPNASALYSERNSVQMTAIW